MEKEGRISRKKKVITPICVIVPLFILKEWLHSLTIAIKGPVETFNDCLRIFYGKINHNDGTPPVVFLMFKKVCIFKGAPGNHCLSYIPWGGLTKLSVKLFNGNNHKFGSTIISKLKNVTILRKLPVGSLNHLREISEIIFSYFLPKLEELSLFVFGKLKNEHVKIFLNYVEVLQQNTRIYSIGIYKQEDFSGKIRKLDMNFVMKKRMYLSNYNIFKVDDIPFLSRK